MEGPLLLAVAGLAFYGFLQHRQIVMLWRCLDTQNQSLKVTGDWVRVHQDRLSDLEHKGDGYNPAFEMKAFNRDH